MNNTDINEKEQGQEKPLEFRELAQLSMYRSLVPVDFPKTEEADDIIEKKTEDDPVKNQPIVISEPENSTAEEEMPEPVSKKSNNIGKGLLIAGVVAVIGIAAIVIGNSSGNSSPSTETKASAENVAADNSESETETAEAYDEEEMIIAKADVFYDIGNYDEAVKSYQEAANQGNAYAENKLGYCYQNGLGVTQDYELAVEWYQKAADQGNATAQSNIGVYYEYGHAVTQDYKTAVEWYQKAADQGNEYAEFNLAICYLNGNGVNKDEEKAITLLKASAEDGYTGAQDKLTELGY